MRNNIKDFLNERVVDLNKEPNCKNRFIKDSLISLKFEDGHIHHLLPPDLSSKKELIESLLAQEGIPVEKESTDLNIRPIIFKNRQAIGDILMMTCLPRDFKKAFPDWPINVITTAMNLWKNNPYLDRSLTPSNAEVIEIGPGYLTNASNRDDRHFANAFRISAEDKLGVSIPQGPIKPDIWMTEEEIASPIIEPPYWIIVAGEKGDWTAKTYPFDRWQEVVSALPNIKFVQIGAKEHKHPALDQPNVINMIGKTQDKDTGIRDLFRLFYFAEGSMGLVSFQMHLAAAFNMPCIVIAGAREPARFTRFPGHQYLCTDGCLPCSIERACWHCDLEKTCPYIVTGKTGQKYPKCVDIIKTEDVMRAFYQLYDGGRLSFNHPRKPTIPNPIIKKENSKEIIIPLTPNIITEKKEEKKEYLPLGFTWGRTHITEFDWEFLESVLEKHNVSTILEFGPGLSTKLLSQKSRTIISFENDEAYYKKLLDDGFDKICNLNLWDGKQIHGELGKFDLAIVDGPAGGSNREFSTKIASEHSDIVLIHDAGRKYEKEWQDKYLVEKFDGPGKGGNRWHLWVKKGKKLEETVEGNIVAYIKDKEFYNHHIEKENSANKVEEEYPEFKEVIKEVVNREGWIEGEIVVPTQSNKKLFRIFSNTRGDGGCGRSIDWFMKAFIKIGWDVEYVYSNPKPSGTHIRCGNPSVLATNNLDLIRAPCDVFLLTSDDYVWEFKKEEVASLFSNINAKRKVMYINYRIGEIGKITWTWDWDKYLFLNSELEEAFTSNYMKSHSFDQIYSFSTKVLPPPTSLDEYYKNEINYEGNLKIVRHSSQGNAKYSNDFNSMAQRIFEKIPDATIRLMPPPSFIENFEGKIIKHQRNSPSVNEFLAMGNVFWYNLPNGYTEGGPKVILEAMASGLAVVTGNHSGPKDRVIHGVNGFLCDSFEEELEALFELSENVKLRVKMGEAAREHAKKNFDPENWIKEITGENNGS
jgi:ADP-heptose:LPS heptosyltransferase